MLDLSCEYYFSDFIAFYCKIIALLSSAVTKDSLTFCLRLSNALKSLIGLYNYPNFLNTTEK